jgi:uncharacterized delta-60 repeat protein
MRASWYQPDLRTEQGRLSVWTKMRDAPTPKGGSAMMPQLRGPTLVASGTTLLVIVAAALAAAAPGDLDVTFDGDGKVTTDIASSNDRAYGMAIQPDGKIVSTGSAFFFVDNGARDIAVTRHNTNGSLDTSFDGDGKVVTDFSTGSSDIGRDVAVQADGKLVVAGGALGDFALARYNADGSLDSTFGGGDGKVTTDFGGTGDAHAVAVQGDGKIVAAGGGPGDFALARYNADGSLDTAFDGDGKVTTDFGGTSDSAYDMVIQGDGKIVAAGYPDFAIARYNSDGSLDTAFDGDGKLTTNFGSGSGWAEGVTVQADGKIVMAGFAILTQTGDFGVARYNGDGSLDTAFDGDGKVTTDFNAGNDHPYDVAVQVDGKIVVAGCAGMLMCEDDPRDDLGLARYNTNGSLDTTFGGGDGKVTTDFSGDTNWAHAVALQRDGRIVTAGFSPWNPADFALTRYKVCRPTSRRSSIPC